MIVMMGSYRRIPRLSWLVTLGVGVAGLGCSEPDPAGARQGYWPDEKTAKAALQASLESWSPGQVQASLSARRPRVETWDSTRGNGRELLGFDILGLVGTGQEQIFAVKLTLGNPPEERTERYLVRGLDPIWVFLFEDYERISHWEHEMTVGGESAPVREHHPSKGDTEGLGANSKPDSPARARADTESDVERPGPRP